MSSPTLQGTPAMVPREASKHPVSPEFKQSRARTPGKLRCRLHDSLRQLQWVTPASGLKVSQQRLVGRGGPLTTAASQTETIEDGALLFCRASDAVLRGGLELGFWRGSCTAGPENQRA